MAYMDSFLIHRESITSLMINGSCELSIYRSFVPFPFSLEFFFLTTSAPGACCLRRSCPRGLLPPQSIGKCPPPADVAVFEPRAFNSCRSRSHGPRPPENKRTYFGAGDGASRGGIFA